MTESRQLIVFRGEPGTTRLRSIRACHGLDPEMVLWVGTDAPDGVRAARSSEIRKLLGRSFDVVILDLHDTLDADLIGACHGFVWGGGALILRLSKTSMGDSRLAAFPYEASDVGARFRRHLDRVFETLPQPTRLCPTHALDGTVEQAAVVDVLRQRLVSAEPTLTTLLADRGRGKSSALGLAIRDVPGPIVVTAGHPDAASEIVRFAPGQEFVPIQEALSLKQDSPRVIVVDEAAQLPVPVLKRLTGAFPRAHIVFATTTHGYEGTGRGFVLRFMPWLEQDPRPVHAQTLETPIRWGEGDQLEAHVFRALLLDAEIANHSEIDVLDIRAERLDRDALVANEQLLREFFGLLVHAHYRTTPGDLHRLLDAPNLNLHALLSNGHVVAATWVADEGGLTPELAQAVYDGRERLRGHALTESIVSQLGHLEAADLAMKRSVRIAVHPAFRRRGLGTRLIEHVHASYDTDLWGTVFGATAELIEFRRRAGYRLVRVSASRGARSGEPSVMMLRATSERARTGVETLRREFARDLEVQLRLLTQAGPLAPELVTALEHHGAEPAALSDAELERTVEHYLDGPRTFESAATAVRAFVLANESALAHLDDSESALIQARVVELQPWSTSAERAGLAAPHIAMRALRRAMRSFADATGFRCE